MVFALLLAMVTAVSPSQRGSTADVGTAASERRSFPLLDSPQLASTLGPLRAELGSWVEYIVRTRGDQDVRFRVSAVPPALEGGRVWLEVTALGSESLPFAARLLIVVATGKLERAILYALGQAPLHIPVDSGERAIGSARDAASVQVVHGRREEVTVPAGTFLATKLLISAGRQTMRAWKSDAVPLWGLVRAHDGRRTIELLRYGHGGARSVFPSAQGKGRDSANE
jgi:hypothetical protein